MDLRLDRFTERETLILTGSRGLPSALVAPADFHSRCFRVAHRALPLQAVEDILEAARGCRHLIAIGGGTVMDAAKAMCSLQAEPSVESLHLIPTTFGTGAEVTPFASVYDAAGLKRSLLLASGIEVKVSYIPALLYGLPLAEFLAGLCDAFTHSFEALWALGATAASSELAADGLGRSVRLAEAWMGQGPGDSYKRFLEEHAAALQAAGRSAGQAIAIAKTTAAHALSYELTQSAQIPHGYAVAIFLPALYALALRSPHLGPKLERQVGAMGLRDSEEVHAFLRKFVEAFIPSLERQHIAKVLRQGRKQPPCPIRIANFPIDLDQQAVEGLDQSTIAVCAVKS